MHPVTSPSAAVIHVDDNVAYGSLKCGNDTNDENQYEEVEL